MKEVENVLRIFKETKKALEQRDSFKLKDLSNQTIHTASITQDPDNIAVAVMIYSLGKILERGYHETSKGARFYKTIVSAIDKSILDLENGDKDAFRKELDLIRIAISKLSGDLRNYIQDVFNKASINKASKLYEHGISMEKTARLLGISLWEMATYLGQRGAFIDTRENETISVKDRLKLATEMFS